jgi:hypothetical protein
MIVPCFIFCFCGILHWFSVSAGLNGKALDYDLIRTMLVSLAKKAFPVMPVSMPRDLVILPSTETILGPTVRCLERLLPICPS